ncbi:MAG: ABC transporter substrate-binding protein [Crocinitomicaceae bacterium]|nr:ABC transporter substrate-binding protein [Crocinitomicaceae bacterium]
MISLEDQIGNQIQLSGPAKRIVSLVPSQTELLYFFGLENETVGITKFCIHPEEWFRSKTRVGGTKNVQIQKVRELKPDLIIANKEENTKEDIIELQEICPVYVSDVNNVDQALQMIRQVGELCGVEQKAVELIDDIRDDFGSLPNFNQSAIYLIWNEPFMACGKDNFINAVMESIGLKNLIEDSRYITISKEELIKKRPDVILLSTEPFPFTTEHCYALEHELGVKVRLVDGEMFSWYGSRMLKMKDYFRKLNLD